MIEYFKEYKKRLHIKIDLVLMFVKIRWNDNLFNDDIVFLLIKYFNQVYKLWILVKQYSSKLIFGYFYYFYYYSAIYEQNWKRSLMKIQTKWKIFEIKQENFMNITIKL
jgi:hypothetical protein